MSDVKNNSIQNLIQQVISTATPSENADSSSVEHNNQEKALQNKKALNRKTTLLSEDLHEQKQSSSTATWGEVTPSTGKGAPALVAQDGKEFHNEQQQKLLDHQKDYFTSNGNLLAAGKDNSKSQVGLESPKFAQNVLTNLAEQPGVTKSSLTQAATLINTLVTTKTPYLGQRGAIDMMMRVPGQTSAFSNLDVFVRDPKMLAAADSVRGTLTNLAARSNSDKEVTNGFLGLLGDSTFISQHRKTQGAIAQVLGFAGNSSMRAVSDTMLQALNSGMISQEPLAANRTLKKMTSKLRESDGKKLDLTSFKGKSESSAMPPIAALAAVENLTDEEAQKAGAKNRATLLSYFQKVQKFYDHQEAQLDKASCFEEVHVLSSLLAPAEINSQLVGKENVQLLAQKQVALQQRFRELSRKKQSLQKIFRNVHRPVEKVELPKPKLATRVTDENNTKNSKQVSNATKESANTPTPSLRSLATTSGESRLDRIEVLLETLLLKLHNQSPELTVNKEPVRSPTLLMTGKQDSWGVQRTFSKELGAGIADHAPLPIANSGVSGPSIPKLTMRSEAELKTLRWKELNLAESAHYAQAGWNQREWDAMVLKNMR